MGEPGTKLLLISGAAFFLLFVAFSQALSPECGEPGLSPPQNLFTHMMFSDPSTTFNVLQPHTALSNGAYKLIMQRDCNLVVCLDDRQVVWQSNTAGKGQDCNLRLTGDGNLVIFQPAGMFVNLKLWETGITPGPELGPFRLLLEPDGEVIVVTTQLEVPVWSTYTQGLA